MPHFLILEEIYMRKVDNLGRIVIPKELRIKYGMTEGSDITFEDNGDGVLVKGCNGLCRICGNLLDGELSVPLCKSCIEALTREVESVEKT